MGFGCAAPIGRYQQKEGYAGRDGKSYDDLFMSILRLYCKTDAAILQCLLAHHAYFEGSGHNLAPLLLCHHTRFQNRNVEKDHDNRVEKARGIIVPVLKCCSASLLTGGAGDVRFHRHLTLLITICFRAMAGVAEVIPRLHLSPEPSTHPSRQTRSDLTRKRGKCTSPWTRRNASRGALLLRRPVVLSEYLC